MNKKAQIAVLGDGAWGTVLALLLHKNGHKVTLWGPFPQYIDEMKKSGRNHKFIPDAIFPEGFTITGSMEEASANADYFVMASPSQYARGTIEKLAPCFDIKKQSVINVAKGIENGTLKRVSEICAELLGEDCRYAALSGPSHAEEVVKNLPTAVVAASKDEEFAIEVQQLFINNTFRVYSTDDVVGVELGGALKNVLAIAAGVIDGMKIGDNPKAALMTRGIAEMARLGIALGGRFETFSGLSGIGDLIVTCTSGHSRNRHVGEELGRGKTLDVILKEMGMVVAEGVRTSESAWQLSQKCGADTPIINEVYEVLYKNKNSEKAVYDLMSRRARSERDMMRQA